MDQIAFKTYLDTAGKKQLLAILLLFLVILLAFAIGCIFVVYPFQYFYGNTVTCESKVDSAEDFEPDNCHNLYQTDDNIFWAGRLKGLEKMNQLLVLYVFGYQDEDHHLGFDVDLRLWIRGRDRKEGNEDDYHLIRDGDTHTKDITCDDGECTQSWVHCEPFIRYEEYDAFISIDPTTNVINNIRNINFKFLTVDPTFTKTQLGFKVFFSIISIFTCLIYYWKIKPLKEKERSFEIQQIFHLSKVLILFNDPLFVFNATMPSYFWSILSCLFLVLFVISLLYFWLAAFQRVRETTETITNTTNVIKYLYFIFFGIFLFMYYAIHLLRIQDDPSYDVTHQQNSTELAFFVILILFIAFYCFWIIYSFAMACSQFKNILTRKKALLVLNLIIMVMTICLLLVGALGPYSAQGGAYIFSIIYISMYIYFLQILFSPSMESIKETREMAEGEMQPIPFYLPGDSQDVNQPIYGGLGSGANNPGGEGSAVAGGFRELGAEDSEDLDNPPKQQL